VGHKSEFWENLSSYWKTQRVQNYTFVDYKIPVYCDMTIKDNPYYAA
jgi:hypothetical protein